MSTEDELAPIAGVLAQFPGDDPHNVAVREWVADHFMRARAVVGVKEAASIVSARTFDADNVTASYEERAALAHRWRAARPGVYVPWSWAIAERHVQSEEEQRRIWREKWERRTAGESQ